MSDWAVLYFYQGRREPGGRRERLAVREAVITGVTIEWDQLTGDSKPKQLNVRASAAEHARWLAASNRAGRNLQTWVREALNLAATQV